MKLALIAGLSAVALFVGTLPHIVGAMFSPPIREVFLLPCPAPMKTMKQSAKEIGKNKVMAMYHNKYEWLALFLLWNKESKWDYTAKNKRSSAFGIPQMIDMPTDTPMIRQIELGLKYIQHRYGTPTKALAFHNANGWY